MEQKNRANTLDEAIKHDLADLDSNLADSLFEKYKNSFNENYINNYTAKEIANDIFLIKDLTENNQYAITIAPSKRGINNIWQIKLLKFADSVSLSRGLPIIENFGVKMLDEHPYTINIKGDMIYVCDFGVEVPNELANKINDEELANYFKEAIVAAFNRQIENDALNKLVLHSGLNSHQVTLLRAITQYLVQTTLPFSRQYMAQCLKTHAKVAHDLFDLFKAKFGLDRENADTKIKNITKTIEEYLTHVNSLDEDRILHAFLGVIQAMVRTNYYQVDANGNHKPYISFKIESHKLNFLPKPHPLYEIFVYSINFEAIHLRGGKVSRGGLRWSDRREDFRTEVLGLVKAQIVKNSVIVPTGSKGGFVCKRLPPIENREAYMAEGIKCYKNFISGLLDITDNLVAGKIIPPTNVVRHDGDDPYLVVAADKGTATFSDYANEMSQKYNFWLGDAFASGGSAGYDHKKIGITAKGAWESAKRHFRHLSINTQTQDFTVIGIGDMSGDVFGNGMLLSPHIGLLAAFNHQHIFLDPNPNRETSFAERKRMFNLPRSTWDDYDRSKISKGGGIFERSNKFIPLSPEIKEWLNLEVNELTPNELIHNILKAKADMLYNGGIGTYIKSESETHDMVKDKVNDQLRINGKDLNVKVVVEGGNLGVTQLGRIEFARKGGFIYNDAIDNSAGVDCSDHEVNIKILLANVMQTTNMDITERNKILESMTDNVSNLVLRDNYLQTQILRYAVSRSKELFSIQVNFIEKLEKRGELDRSVEFLPSDKEIVELHRIGIGLTLPELAVLLAYSKMILDRDILNSKLTESDLFHELLVNYFPDLLKEKFPEHIDKHYLKKEIISNQLANLIINRMGITFISRFQDELKTDTSNIIKAFWVVYKLIDAEKIFNQIEALDNIVNADLQVDLLIRLKKTLERTTRWVLKNCKKAEIPKLITKFGPDIKHLMEKSSEIIKLEDYPDINKMYYDFIAKNVPEDLAKILIRTNYIPQFIDIARLALESSRKVESVAENYFYLGRELQIDWLRKNLISLPESNKWQALSRSALLTEGYALFNRLTQQAITKTNVKDDHFARAWVKQEADKIHKLNSMFEELRGFKVLDLSMLSAVIWEFSNIFQED